MSEQFSFEHAAEQAWGYIQPQDRTWLYDLAQRAKPGKVALVGGAVRDALLGKVPLDLDIVIEGANISALVTSLGSPYILHPEFGNATMTLSDGRQADLVQARRERYSTPGKNPIVASSTLEDDLRRRDFGVNALALQILPDKGLELIDVVGGLADLQQRSLRPLSPRSLYEDASRVVRAARLAARLDFQAHPTLLKQIPDALAVAHCTPRLYAELRLLLHEPSPGRAASILEEWGAGGLLPEGAAKRLESLDNSKQEGKLIPAVVYIAALLSLAQYPERLSAQLGLGKRPLKLLERAMSDKPAGPGSPEATLRALLCPEAYRVLTGRDVLALGVPPGPAVGEVLEYLRQLRNAGKVRSPEDERAALRRYIESYHN